MQINIVFGSPSDKPVYERLCQDLEVISGLELKVEVCSAHRDPERLRKLIKENPCDLFIAGAGLSAHLPGVIASQTDKPVIGLPCNDILEGMDALLSTLQMPKGVPVLAAGVESTKSVVQFIRWWAANKEQIPTFQIHRPAWAEKLAEQLCLPLEKIGWNFVNHRTDVDHPPAIFPLLMTDLLATSFDETTIASTSKSPGSWLGLPVLAQPKFNGDLKLFKTITSTGGLWVGVNNITNLQLALLKLWPLGSKEMTLMNELKGGIKQNVS